MRIIDRILKMSGFKHRRDNVEFDGQKYVDKAVYQTVGKPLPLSPIEEALGCKPARPIEELSHYERVRLRWMKPDGKGGLMPK